MVSKFCTQALAAQLASYYASSSTPPQVTCGKHMTTFSVSNKSFVFTATVRTYSIFSHMSSSPTAVW